jgi:ADP-ribose pyrophosphatase
MLELGETLRQGAEREALEETGLVVLATDLLGVFDRIVPDPVVQDPAEPNGMKRMLYHYVLIDFLCQRISGDVLAGGDADDARWFTPADLSELPLPEETLKVLQIGIAKAK